MKKTIITMAITMAILGACRQEQPSSFEKYNEANIENYVKLTGYNTNNLSGKEIEQEPGSVNIGIFEVTIHRASRDCLRGLGFCDFTWFPGLKSEKISRIETDDKIITNLYLENNNYYFNIYAKEQLFDDIPVELLGLTVDEEIVKQYNMPESKTLLIRKGFYTFDQSLGKFGGYKIEVQVSN